MFERTLKDWLILLGIVYSFFICFIMNIFGYTLSYDPLTYEWHIRNIHEARQAVFNHALIHFALLVVCAYLYLRQKITKHQQQFRPVKSSEQEIGEQQTHLAIH